MSVVFLYVQCYMSGITAVSNLDLGTILGGVSGYSSLGLSVISTGAF